MGATSNLSRANDCEMRACSSQTGSTLAPTTWPDTRSCKRPLPTRSGRKSDKELPRSALHYRTNAQGGIMSICPFLVALLAVLPVLSLADVAVPNTPAGHAFGAWLDAFNSTDRASKEAFVKTYGPWIDPDNSGKWRAETGGYDLLEVYSNDKTNVFFRVKARTNTGEEIGRLRVSETEPVAVEGLITWRIPVGTTLDAVPLDAKARPRLVERVAEAFDSSYVYPEIGKKMAAALRQHEKHGEYRSIRYSIDLARKLTKDLQEISHDKHAEVRFSFFVRPTESAADRSEAESQRLAANNCGF